MHISRSNKPSVVVTMGDPSGIGPEVTLKALASPEVKGLANFLLVGDASVIARIRKDMGLKLDAGLLDMANVRSKKFVYGVEDPVYGRAAVEYLDKALEILDAVPKAGLVTAPINKSSIRKAGFKDFQGHTEYLAAKTQTKDFAMMFDGEKLKIALVTRHMALKDVPRRLTSQLITRTIILAHSAMRKDFGIGQPRIGVAGLNPHAGENSSFGDEEKAVIAPAIKQALKKVSGVTGPYSPDVIFNNAMDGKFDCVVSMYHDQALIPFKLLYFRDGVNMTLGLPFIRTSPDHGTAFDIAGKGVADPSSMIEAIKLACRLTRK